MSRHEGPKGPLIRYAMWSCHEWLIIAHERVGGKELGVVSVQFSFPRKKVSGK